MQAVIIAGGLGTRLRPLTYTCPKPLIPLLNREMVLHVLDRLPRDVEDVILPVNYMVDKMQDFFRENDVGKNVAVVEEKTPLGTGGALKNIEEYLGERFLVFNGDVISSINIGDMLRLHRNMGGVGTLALWEVDDPSAFGSVKLGKDGRVTRFVEKPTKGKAPSNLINAGVYVLEREVLDFIPGGKPVSIEREVFPKLLKMGLNGFRFEGYWADAGTLHNYLRSMKLLLSASGSSINRSATIEEGATVQKPVALGPRCRVNGIVGPNASLGADCVINGGKVEDSALLSKVIVRKGAVVLRSIVGEGCMIEAGASVVDTILGEKTVVKAGRKAAMAG